MTEFEKYLFDEFKWLDSICRDMFSCQYGISEYITQMERAPVYLQRQIPGWERDYRSLKRLRWLRNQIAHETSVTDCSMNDIEQLEDFYDRILNQQDPLALLETIKWKVGKAPLQEHGVVPQSRPYPNSGGRQNSPRRTDNSRSIFGVVVFVVVLAISICFIWFLK